MNSWIAVLIVGILTLLAIGVASQEESGCKDIGSFDSVSANNERFKAWNLYDNNAFEVHPITTFSNDIMCIKMEIQKDDPNFKFFWLKDRGTKTYLEFYINGNRTATYFDEIGHHESRVNKSDKLMWKIKIIGTAWIAIPSQSYLPKEKTTTATIKDTPPASEVRKAIIDETGCNKIEVNGGNLQDWINNSSGPTELILTNRTYTIDEPIKIENKNNLVIKSNADYVNIKGGNNDKMIILNNSTYITLSGIRMECPNNGIKINNSNNCLIRDNQIGFKLHGYGISIINSSENIKIIDNLIWPSESKDKSSKEVSLGIKMEKSKSIYVENNEIINKNGQNSLLAYYVADCGSVSDITIIPNCENPDKKLKIMYGSCVGFWSCNGEIHNEIDSSGNPCKIRDNNDSERVWGIK